MSSDHAPVQEPEEKQSVGKDVASSVWFLVLCALGVFVAGIVPMFFIH